MLKGLLAPPGTIDALPQEYFAQAMAARSVMSFHLLTATEHPVWRVSMVPMEAYKLVASLRMGAAVDAFYDWQGGLVWLRMEGDPEAEAVRALIRKYGGGHATLVRASTSVRAALPVFEPQPAPLAALSKRLEAAIRPERNFEPGPHGRRSIDVQTNFTPEQLLDPGVAESEKILRKCVHCGFCTATCPTYVTLGNELDSPRGRIYLIKDMLENGRPADEQIVKHIDRCLSCLPA